MLRLTEYERTQALEDAAKMRAGAEPTFEKFSKGLHGNVPRAVTASVIIALVTIFAGAFWFSAVRLFIQGYNAGERLALSRNLSVSVGASTVVMAEAAIIGFFFALAVLVREKAHAPGTPWYLQINAEKVIYWAGILLSAVLAITGNVVAAAPWAVHGPEQAFAWMEAIFPSLILIGDGYALKSMSLTSIIQRTAALRQFKEAHAVWAEWFKRPLELGERDGRFHSILAKLTREKLARKNAKRYDFSTWQNDDWLPYIRTEIKEYFYTFDLRQQTVEEIKQEVQEEAGLSADELGEIKVETVLEGTAQIWHVEGQGWYARSLASGETMKRAYDTKKKALMILKQHHTTWAKRQSRA